MHKSKAETKPVKVRNHNSWFFTHPHTALDGSHGGGIFVMTQKAKKSIAFWRSEWKSLFTCRCRPKIKSTGQEEKERDTKKSSPFYYRLLKHKKSVTKLLTKQVYGGTRSTHTHTSTTVKGRDATHDHATSQEILLFWNQQTERFFPSFSLVSQFLFRIIFFIDIRLFLSLLLSLRFHHHHTHNWPKHVFQEFL